MFQANNAYIFPGFGLGLIMCGAIRVHDDMLLAACKSSETQKSKLHLWIVIHNQCLSRKHIDACVRSDAPLDIGAFNCIPKFDIAHIHMYKPNKFSGSAPITQPN